MPGCVGGAGYVFSDTGLDHGCRQQLGTTDGDLTLKILYCTLQQEHIPEIKPLHCKLCYLSPNINSATCTDEELLMRQANINSVLRGPVPDEELVLMLPGSHE